MIRARRATTADAEPITALVEKAYAHYVERLGRRPAPMDVDYVTEIRDREVWIIPGDTELEGVLVVRPERDHLFVHNIAVDPALQGHGLGKALLELAEARARELGVTELRLLTNELMTENRALYADLGWQESDVRSEHGYRRVYFRKRLYGPVRASPRGGD